MKEQTKLELELVKLSLQSDDVVLVNASAVDAKALQNALSQVAPKDSKLTVLFIHVARGVTLQSAVQQIPREDLAELLARTAAAPRIQ